MWSSCQLRSRIFMESLHTHSMFLEEEKPAFNLGAIFFLIQPSEISSGLRRLCLKNRPSLVVSNVRLDGS
jgi:hypothetical protein